MTERRGAIDLWSGVGIVVASMVGTGVMVSNGYMASSLSPGQTFAVWGIQALMAAAGAVAYARISRLIPRSGGEYRYLSELLHPAVGYIAGWTSLLVGFAAPVAANAALAGSFAEELGAPVPGRVFGAGLIALVTLFQIFDLRAAKWSQNLLVLIKASLFLGLIGAGVTLGSHELPATTPSAAPAEVFAINLFFAAYAFSGWNASIYAAEEFVRPARDVGRSMLIGVAAVTALYLAITYVFVFNLGPDELGALGDSRERSVHTLVAKLLGPGAAYVASFGIILVLLSSTNVMTFVGPRVNAAMARDGYLPRWFSGRAGRPPAAAIACQGGIALALMLSHSVEGLVKNVGIMLTVMSTLTVLGLIRVRLWAHASHRLGGTAGDRLALVAAVMYLFAGGWMLHAAVKNGASGVLWAVVVAAVALAAYALTRRLGSASR